MDLKHWLAGLVAAFVNGCASAVVLLLADPLAFNFDAGLKKLLATSALFGILGAANFLKQSPIPTKLLLVFALLVPLYACGPVAPPNLTPQAQVAWQNMQIEKDLDLARDLVHDGNAAGVFSNPTTRVITQWHKAAILALHTRGEGWVDQIRDATKALTTASSTIPKNEQSLLLPYLTTVLKALGGS